MRRFGIISNLRNKGDIPLVFPECRNGKLPPFKVWSKFDVFGRAKGYIIVLSLTGSEVMDLRHNGEVRKRILDAIIYGEEQLGIELFGLTSLTSSVTRKGQWLVDCGSVTASLTHGDSYAAGITIKGIEMIAEKINRRLEDLTIAIIGAYGLIGKVLSTVLSQKGCSLILIGPNKIKLQRLINNILCKRGITLKVGTILNPIRDADIIITATNNSNALVSSNHLKSDPWVVIYEVSVPPNLPYENYLKLRIKRPNAVKIDGALVSIPGIDLGVQITDVPKGVTFACWAETIMQCLENDQGDYVGEIAIPHMEKTMIWGRKYGFSHAPLSCFGKAIPEDTFLRESIKEMVF